MSKSELRTAAENTTETLTNSAEIFTSTLMGKSFKPLVNALIRYIKITNARLNKIEGKSNGN